ncbi:MAG: Leucyl-tRNA synthetase [Parcubacteria group bacterium GW2011_GWC1_34_10]|nr:MAG: Leucyl-tRNA synthetase [Parcubacteria group bacterium GW2011_GWC1_34_10]
MNEKYDHKDPTKPKSYVLDMFPYPSGEGLHVGHPKGYIATDIYSRMKKMQGYNILHPMGWDAFGLPAENFAIKNKIHPRIAVEKNIKRFKEQLSKIGFNYDWNREINTTDPGYYKWTQWVFLKMLKKGLAYESFEPINWCPSCQTGLANEDLDGGLCERCGSVVEKRPMRQWVLKITEYADRMLKDLDKLDWPEHIKEAQRNWIGKSEGTELEFKIKGNNSPQPPLKLRGGEQSEGELGIKVFTTRVDTLFGVTYLVLAPEHPIIEKLKDSKIENWNEVEKYIKETKAKTEIERTDAKKEKSGVEIKGIKAINPANGEEVPIFVADYVLANYGTGAVMAVPAHDERDFKFAKKYNLPIKQVIIPRLIDKSNPHIEGKETIFRDAVIVVVKNPKTDKYLCLKWKKHPWVTFVMGGIDKGEGAIEAAKREIEEETGYKNVKFIENLGLAQSEFYAAHKGVNRVAHTRNLFFELVNEEKSKISEEESEIHEIEWRSFDEIQNSDMTHSEMPLILDGLKKGMKPYTEEGILFDSGEFTKIDSETARERITKKFGEKVTKYKLRDWVFSRQRYWGEPIPVVHCQKCGVVSVSEKDLPVTLPEVERYEPTGNGESPLENITDWVNTKCPKCGSPAKRETNTMPQWAGSSWYYLRFIDPKNSKTLVDPEKEKYWAPVDVYVGGDHAVRHLIYARFWHKFLFDIGSVSTIEPFARLEFLGFILAKDGKKMSKRWNNIINPDDIVNVWGADTLRMYEMFMGPFENTIAWNDDNLIGVRRFIERIWKFSLIAKKTEEGNNNQKLENLLHKTIKKVTEDIENYKFNTAISTMMIFLNELEKLDHTSNVSKTVFDTFLKLLAPFAPHMTEEIWHGFGHKTSIHLEEWPKFDESKIKEENTLITIQINGKVRGQLEIKTGASEETVKEKALNLSEIQKWLADKKAKKVIFVPDRIINFVI